MVFGRGDAPTVEGGRGWSLVPLGAAAGGARPHIKAGRGRAPGGGAKHLPRRYGVGGGRFGAGVGGAVGQDLGRGALGGEAVGQGLGGI